MSNWRLQILSELPSVYREGNVNRQFLHHDSTLTVLLRNAMVNLIIAVMAISTCVFFAYHCMTTRTEISSAAETVVASTRSTKPARNKTCLIIVNNLLTDMEGEKALDSHLGIPQDMLVVLVWVAKSHSAEVEESLLTLAKDKHKILKCEVTHSVEHINAYIQPHMIIAAESSMIESFKHKLKGVVTHFGTVAEICASLKCSEK